MLYPMPCQWMIVGDVQQCIYEWRGASADIMASQFDRDFGNVATYPLSTSFRFGHAVGLMASSVISENDPDALVIGAGARTRVSFARAPKTGKALLGELKAWVDEGRALSDTGGIGAFVQRHGASTVGSDAQRRAVSITR